MKIYIQYRSCKVETGDYEMLQYIEEYYNFCLVFYSGAESVLAFCTRGTGRAGLASDVDRSSQMVARGVIVTDQVVELVILLLTLY